MKRIIIRTAVAFAFMALAILPLSQFNAMSQESGKGCKLQGTWIGQFSGFTFTATFQGTGDNEGTLELEFIDVPVPTPKSMTPAKGVWTKTGPNTYDITYQTFFVEKIEYGPFNFNHIGFIGLASGSIILTGCNAAEINASAAYFLPGADEPFMPPESSTATMHRMLLNQPAPLP